ncbi:MAG: ROK family protein [Nitrospirae bacterium]|nr:ROK family protein [Nitrospirota bacterium]
MKSAIGIDIGGTNIKAIRMSETGDVLNKITEPTPLNNIPDKISGIIRRLLSSEVSGIGFGIAGIIDKKNGIILESPNISSLNNTPVKALFEKEFSVPVIIENDANVYAYSEKLVGAGKKFDNFVAITLGTGLGGGMIYKGRLFEGAFEVGHMIVEPEGRFCPCGNHGCLESYASGRALVDRAISLLEKGEKSILRESHEGNFYKITPEIIYKTAFEGDTLSRDIFREFGRYLGIGIANIINIVSPEAVILGGGLIGAWDLFIEDVKREVSKRALKSLSQKVEILKTTLSEGGSIGAAGLVFSQLKTD